MAEQVESGSAPGATATPPPDAASNSNAGYTVEELRDVILDVLAADLNPRLDSFYRGVDQRITGLEMLRPQLEEVVGTARKTDLILQHLAKGSLSEEEQGQVGAAVTAMQTKVELDRAKAQAEAATKAAQAARPTDAALDARDFDLMKILAKQDAEREGLPWSVAEPLMDGVERRWSPGDERGWGSWRANLNTKYKAEADRRLAEQKTRTAVPDARGGGAPEKLDSISLIKRGLARG